MQSKEANKKSAIHLKRICPNAVSIECYVNSILGIFLQLQLYINLY